MNKRCIANHYACEQERIIEFSFHDKTHASGLISFALLPSGKCRIELYRMDGNIEVIVGGDASDVVVLDRHTAYDERPEFPHGEFPSAAEVSNPIEPPSVWPDDGEPDYNPH